MKQKINIIWCKRNLRVNDNEILSKLDTKLPSLAVYFFEFSIMNAPDYSNFHLKFTLESLLELQVSFYKIGIPLLLLPYEAVEGFEKLHKYYDIENIYSHEETGNLKTFARDKKVITYCKTESIHFKEFHTNGVVRRLRSRDDWSDIWAERMNSKTFSPQTLSQKIELAHELQVLSKETKAEYQEKVSETCIAQKGGESIAKSILKDFLDSRCRNYSYHISKPLESQTGCSRLSPYIAYGCISIKYIFQECLKKIVQLQSIDSQTAKNHRKAINFFLARIHWQSHFIQKLEDEPRIENINLNIEFDSIRTKAHLKIINAVFESRSGIPYIDAVMKQLHQTGRTNFRSRAILVSFLCNTCMQPWQYIGPKLAQLFTDYEPGIHYPQMQMQSGTTGINTIRVYNPVYNSQQKDPNGKCIYYYLPELRSVPVEYIHEPHKWENFSTIDYPEPIVDIKSANKKIKDILWEMKGHIPAEKKAAVVKKHASRAFHSKKKKTPVKQRSANNIDIEKQTSLF